MSTPADDIADILVDIYNQEYESTAVSSKSTTKVSRKRHNRDTDAVVGPVFNIISDTTSARLKAAAAMAGDNQTEDGHRFTTELSSKLKAVDAEPSTLIMWPAEDLDEGEILNGDTSADLEWVFAIIISLSPTTMRARIIGTIYGDNTVCVGSFVRFDTPPFFIVPEGVNGEAAKECLAKIEKGVESGTPSVEEHDGLSATVFKKTDETIARGYLDDLDGGRRLCRDMTQSSKREAILGPVWRLTKGRELEVAGRGNLLQAKEYLRCIWAAAIDPSLDTMGPFSSAPLIFQITALKVTTDVATLTFILQAGEEETYC